ncbi:cache domain-containing protein, partial [Campylobacter canadensis]
MKISYKISLCILVALAVLSFTLIVSTRSLVHKVESLSFNTTEELAVDDAKKTAKSVVKAINHFTDKAYEDLKNSGATHAEIINRVFALVKNINLDNTAVHNFVMNSNGVYLDHYNKNLINENMLNSPDLNGKYYVKDLVNVSKNGGYVKAKIKGADGNIRNIIIYVEKDSYLDLIYGTTVDIDSAYNDIKATEDKIDEFVTSSIYKFILTAIILSIIILIAMIIFVIKQVSNPLNALT